MGRTRKYATEEEAHEAKKQQMRENYQKRKAEKARAATPSPPKTPPKDEDTPKTKSKRTAKKDSLAEAVNQPPQAEYLKLTKEELLAKFGGLLDSI